MANDKDKTQKIGHAKADCRKWIKDLAAAVGRPAGAMLQEEVDAPATASRHTAYLLALPRQSQPAVPALLRQDWVGGEVASKVTTRLPGSVCQRMSPGGEEASRQERAR
jgi:hypothetical protein